MPDPEDLADSHAPLPPDANPLDRWEEILPLIVEHAPDTITIVDRTGTIQFINRTQPALPAGGAAGRSLFEFLPREEHARFRQALEQAFVARQSDCFEHRLIDGSWWVARVVPLVAGPLPAAMVISTDVTEWRRAEQSLGEDERLLRQLLDLHERERRLLAYEIHDGFLQDVVGAKMLVESLRESAPTEQQEPLGTIESLLHKAVDEGRRMVSELRPLVIDELGIVAAIEHLICDEREAGTAEVEFAASPQLPRLAPLREGALFRMAQESLTNARRHSQARRITVALAQVSDSLRLTVADDGVGFDAAAVPDDRFGLRGLVERARLFGGSARIDSRPGRGTRIVIELPIDDAPAAEARNPSVS